MYVYLIQSVSFPSQRYIGSTDNIQERLKTHNRGASTHTSKYAPWELVTLLWFNDKTKARAFEAYLKTGSGRAFAKKRL